MKDLIKFTFKIYGYILRIEYYFSSRISFIFQKLRGTDYKKRLKFFSNFESLKRDLHQNNIKRLAIFVAFHSSSEIPKSNINYLRLIKNSSFDIIYVHNGKLNEQVRKNLNDLGCFLICRENIGQDFGAWKDTISLLDEFKLINKVDWLLLCNDSNFCLGGKNTVLFQNRFKKILNVKNKKFDFISLNCNFEGSLHHQSYFLCLSKKIIENAKFKNFWRKYIPLNNRYHAIKKGELRFSKLVLSQYRSKILLTSHKLCQSINDHLIEDYKSISNLLPQYLFYLEACFDLYNPKNPQNIKLGISRLINSLESYNQSHVFGLLNIVYLKSPFLKKDIVRIGFFSINQIHELLISTNLKIDKSLKYEIINFLTTQGTPSSYGNTRRIAIRKGIPLFKDLYEYLPLSKTLKFLYDEKNQK